jgi:hypothetical protein
MKNLSIIFALVLVFSAGKAFSCDMKEMQGMDHSKMMNDESVTTKKQVKTVKQMTKHVEHKSVENSIKKSK